VERLLTPKGDIFEMKTEKDESNKKETVTVTISNLIPCQDYNIVVQSCFETNQTQRFPASKTVLTPNMPKKAFS